MLNVSSDLNQDNFKFFQTEPDLKRIQLRLYQSGGKKGNYAPAKQHAVTKGGLASGNTYEAANDVFMFPFSALGLV
jgi:hypothetical protein